MSTRYGSLETELDTINNLAHNLKIPTSIKAFLAYFEVQESAYTVGLCQVQNKVLVKTNKTKLE